MNSQLRYRGEIIKYVLCECGCGTQIGLRRDRLFPCEIKRRGTNYFCLGHRIRGRKHSQLAKEKMRQARLGKNNGLVGSRHPLWNGGRYRGVNGHIWRYISPRCYELEHRVVMSQWLGRPLLRNEIVHHVNGNKTDNRIENLKLCSDVKNCSYHNLRRATMFTFQCVQCGIMFSRPLGKIAKKAIHRFCGVSCRQKYRSKDKLIKNKLRLIGEKSRLWKGGVHRNEGYLRYYNRSGTWRYVHRTLMEQALNRTLGSNEIVHHRNGDKTDNRLENLEVMTRAEHMNHHRVEIKC